MKIAFDAKRAAQNRTGLGNYSRFIARIMRRFAPQHDYLLCIPNAAKVTQLADLPEADAYGRLSPRSWLGRLLPSLWRTFSIPRELRRQKVALYHGLSNELPIGIRHAGIPSVVTIHDVIFLHHPEYYKPIDRFIYRLKFRYAAREADRVIAVSEYTKQELVRWLSVPEDKIDVVYQGQQLDFAQVTAAQRAQVRQQYRLPGRYILYVGTIEERKNLKLAADAMELLRERGILPEDMCLVAVGRSTPYAEDLKGYLQDLGLLKHFIFLHSVAFADLPACYLMADLFVYPSRIEGFGIPMLEAAAAGVPAIGCTGSSLEEAGGEGAFYVDPDDVEAMADCMLRLWNDPALRKERSAMGLAHAERFADRRLFDDLLAVYRKVISL